MSYLPTAQPRTRSRPYTPWTEKLQVFRVSGDIPIDQGQLLEFLTSKEPVGFFIDFYGNPTFLDLESVKYFVCRSPLPSQSSLEEITVW